MFEFNAFVRQHLMLSQWDIMNSDLEEFYSFMDKDGDGIDVYEFLDYVKKINKSKDTLGGQTLYSMTKSESDVSLSRRKHKTYKDRVMEDLRRDRSTLNIKLDLPFVNTGRDRKPASRAAATAGNFF